MTTGNAKQVVRRYLDARLAGDLDTIRDSFSEDAVWRMYGDLPIAGPWRGRDEIVDDFLTTVGTQLYQAGTQHFDFPTLIAEENTVALEWHVTAKTSAGADYDNHYCGIFTVHGNHITEVREYLDTAYAAQTLFPR